MTRLSHKNSDVAKCPFSLVIIRENLLGVLGMLCSPDKGTGEAGASCISCLLSGCRFLDLSNPMARRQKPVKSQRRKKTEIIQTFRAGTSPCPHLGSSAWHTVTSEHFFVD